jgi:hypothetical protein
MTVLCMYCIVIIPKSALNIWFEMFNMFIISHGYTGVTDKHNRTILVFITVIKSEILIFGFS